MQVGLIEKSDDLTDVPWAKTREEFEDMYGADFPMRAVIILEVEEAAALRRLIQGPEYLLREQLSISALPDGLDCLLGKLFDTVYEAENYTSA